MKRFDRIKSMQLVILIVMALAGLITIFRDEELYRLIASNPHIKLLCGLLWVLLAASFVFLFYDFNSWSELRRENMELDHAVYSDALTGIANRYSVDVYIGQYMNKPFPPDMGCVTLDLTSLAEINEKQGHSGGDAAIQIFSDILQNAVAEESFIGRNGGNKFVAILKECSDEKLDEFLQEVSAQCTAHNEAHPQMPISYSWGAAFHEGDLVHNVTELVALSDRRAWKNQFSEENGSEQG